MRTSQEGVNLIKLFEGLSLRSYVCPSGVLTIGYGHTGKDVVENQRITEQQAEILLKKDLNKFEEFVLSVVKPKLNQYQFDALVSFCFNVGTGAFEQSTLLKRINNNENLSQVVKEELPKWNKGEGGKVLEGLSRRRTAEIELFHQAPPKIKTSLTNITARQQTWLKKSTEPVDNLPNDQKAKVYQGRSIRDCKILERKDKHTCLELGFNLGKWWIFDEHWDGLKEVTEIKPYAVDKDLRYLRNFPYFYQQDNGTNGWRQCQTSSIAMCLKYLDVPGIKDDIDYLKYVEKHGDTIYRDTHFKALADLKVSAKFTLSYDAQDVKGWIDKGKPVVAGFLHHGAVSAPTGGGHFVVITGYGKDYWLVQDPFGEADLVNGGWTNKSPTAGKNVRYSFKNFNPRFFVDGGATGWCWYDFKKL